MFRLHFERSERPDGTIRQVPSILCLGAHADDIEIGCGATVLRLLAEHPGTQVTWVVLSADERREAEALASARDFLEGAGPSEIDVQHFRDGHFPFVGAAIKAHFESLKARLAPDLILTHRREDLHQDHRTVAELTWQTFRNHQILEYEIPKYEGDLQTPNVYVPVTTEDANRKMDIILQRFASQTGRRWFRRPTFEAMMRLRGIECNAVDGFAEGFCARKVLL